MPVEKIFFLVSATFSLFIFIFLFAGALAATRIGGNYPFKSDNARFFANLNAFDMFGERFDWMRQNRPIKAKL